MGRAIIHDNVRKYVKQLLWSYTTSQRSQWVVKLNMNSADSPDIENCGNLNKSQYVDHSLKISPQITTLTTIYITSSLRHFFFSRTKPKPTAEERSHANLADKSLALHNTNRKIYNSQTFQINTLLQKCILTTMFS